MKPPTIQQQINALRALRFGVRLDDDQSRAIAQVNSILTWLARPKELKRKVHDIVADIYGHYPSADLQTDAILSLLGIEPKEPPKRFITIKGKKREIFIKRIERGGITYGLK